MKYTRTSNPGAVIDLTLVKAFLRVDHPEEDTLMASMAQGVGLELEQYCDIALLDQTITATTDTWPGSPLCLPVGPVGSGAAVTVEVIEQDGTTTPVTSGFWLEAGRYPRLHWTTTPGAPLRITYTAGFGPDASSVPADLQQAICDQVAVTFDGRDGGKVGAMCPAAARIAARYRRVAL